VLSCKVLQLVAAASTEASSPARQLEWAPWDPVSRGPFGGTCRETRDDFCSWALIALARQVSSAESIALLSCRASRLRHSTRYGFRNRLRAAISQQIKTANTKAQGSSSTTIPAGAGSSGVTVETFRHGRITFHLWVRRTLSSPGRARLGLLKHCSNGVPFISYCVGARCGCICRMLAGRRSCVRIGATTTQEPRVWSSS